MPLASTSAASAPSSMAMRLLDDLFVRSVAVARVDETFARAEILDVVHRLRNRLGYRCARPAMRCTAVNSEGRPALWFRALGHS